MVAPCACSGCANATRQIRNEFGSHDHFFKIRCVAACFLDHRCQMTLYNPKGKLGGACFLYEHAQETVQPARTALPGNGMSCWIKASSCQHGVHCRTTSAKPQTIPVHVYTPAPLNKAERVPGTHPAGLNVNVNLPRVSNACRGTEFCGVWQIQDSRLEIRIRFSARISSEAHQSSAAAPVSGVSSQSW